MILDYKCLIPFPIYYYEEIILKRIGMMRSSPSFGLCYIQCISSSKALFFKVTPQDNNDFTLEKYIG